MVLFRKLLEFEVDVLHSKMISEAKFSCKTEVQHAKINRKWGKKKLFQQAEAMEYDVIK